MKRTMHVNRMMHEKRMMCVKRVMHVKNIMQDRRGEGYMDMCVLVLSAMLVIALAVKVFPVFTTKNHLDSYTNALCREAELLGKIDSPETMEVTEELNEQYGLTPSTTWSDSGKIQLNQSFTVTAKITMDIGLFGSFGSFPVTITSRSRGKSGVYWK